jgi:hypothetical protein
MPTLRTAAVRVVVRLDGAPVRPTPQIRQPSNVIGQLAVGEPSADLVGDEFIAGATYRDARFLRDARPGRRPPQTWLTAREAKW